MSVIDTDQVIHGFRVLSADENSELSGRAVRMRHEKTGARLFWLDNGAENMVFSIAFRTIPEDSTGVFHILEHSVLCGSRDYPVKEPFVELMKSSMSTFLNAMTFPDMTMFPVASRNTRDLMNLTRVYLDAVFHPVVLKDRKRFCQEGWHIDRDENGDPEYRGVVYNEMKGSMSDTDTLIDHQLAAQLFPDTCYGFNSGGDPEEIPDLTWESFCERYHRFYHPSNSYIYLDGNVPMDEMLATIDMFLSEYERRDDFPDFALQVPRGSEETIEYELSPEEDIRDKGHLTLARITGMWSDRAENLARGIICDVLTGSNDAPLKHAALDQGLCQDLNLSHDDTGFQSWTAIHAENVKDGMEKRIMDLLEEEGERIRREGLPRNAVEASLNRMIYNIREEDEPQGIGRCIRCMGSWLYGGEPVEALVTHGLIRDVNSMLDSGRLNELAADMLLNRENLAVLHTRPSHTLGEEKRIAEKERLRRTMSAWTEAQRQENNMLIGELEAWQQSPDPEEAVRMLPMLTRNDVVTAPVWTETEKRIISGVTVLKHPLACNGLVYLRAYFPLTDFSLDELTRSALMAGMLGRLATKKHDALSLQQEIKRCTGGLSFGLATWAREGQPAECTPLLIAGTSALAEYADRARDLLLEVMTETDPSGQEARIREIMMQNELNARQRLTGAGHLLAVKSVLSGYSAEGAARSALDGEPAIRYIHRFAANPEDEMPGLMDAGRKLLREGICRRRMIVSITGTADLDPSPLIQGIAEGNPAPETATYAASVPDALGYRIPSRIGFAARGYHLSRCGLSFHGSMWLACNILTLGYLWNRVRVLGGAYGAGIQIDRSGNIYSYSYRDPTPGKTFTVDAGAADYLREFVRNGENLDKYIISSLNDLNPLLSPRDQGRLADVRIVTGQTRERAEQIRLEILNTQGDDLIRCGEWLDQFARRGGICAVGPQDMLDACGEMEIREI